MKITLQDFGFEPHEGQVRFLLSRKKQIALIAGRGFGKSYALCLKVILQGLENPNKAVGLLGPTYRHLTEVLRPRIEELFTNFRDQTGVSLVKKYHASALKWELVNGSTIYMLSFERATSSTGFDFAAASVDELTLTKNEEKVLQALVNAVRAPGGTLQICHTFTPRGLRGITKTFVERTQAGDPAFQVIHATSLDNPHLDKDNIAMWRRTMSKALYAQEVEAKVLKPGNLVYQEFDRSKHLIEWDFDPGLPYHMACDWGMSHCSYQIWQEAIIDGVKRYVCAWEFPGENVPWGKSKQVLQEIAKECGRDPEILAGDRAITQMQRWASWAFPDAYVTGMDTRKEQEVWPGVELVRSWLDPLEGEPRLLIASHLDNGHPMGIVQSLATQQRVTDAYGVPLDRPYKDNRTDHSLDALRYLVVTLDKNQNQDQYQPAPMRNARPHQRSRFGF